MKKRYLFRPGSVGELHKPAPGSSISVTHFRWNGEVASIRRAYLAARGQTEQGGAVFSWGEGVGGAVGY
ncbi:hypothetical protein P4B35_03355 [Pontiellaceae bacterium B12227]|nr:hypothetical protein [Pontiellaceae bacterium B12227]